MSRDFSQILDISIPAETTGSLSLLPPFRSTTTVYYGFPSDAESLDDADSLLEPERLLTSVSLSPYMGTAFVLDLSDCGEQTINASHILPSLNPFLELEPTKRPRRLLLRTKSAGSTGDKYLSADALLLFMSQSVSLLGIDTAALDPPGQPSNNEDFLRQNNIVWLLGVNLCDAKVLTNYELVAVPVLSDVLGVCACRAVLIAQHGDPGEAYDGGQTVAARA